MAEPSADRRADRSAVSRPLPSLLGLMATDKLIIRAQNDHIRQWLELKQRYDAMRGSDAGRAHKKIPRTTNGDVKQIVAWWHDEFVRAIVRDPFVRDKDNASRERWALAKEAIDKELKGADQNARYARNAWFWQDETFRVALYLQGRKAIPSDLSLIVESVAEAIEESAGAAKELVKDVGDVGGRVVSKLKTGAIIAASILGAAIVLPPVIRALRK